MLRPWRPLAPHPGGRRALSLRSRLEIGQSGKPRWVCLTLSFHPLPKRFRSLLVCRQAPLEGHRLWLKVLPHPCHPWPCIQRAQPIPRQPRVLSGHMLGPTQPNLVEEAERSRPWVPGSDTYPETRGMCPSEASQEEVGVFQAGAEVGWGRSKCG